MGRETGHDTLGPSTQRSRYAPGAGLPRMGENGALGKNQHSKSIGGTILWVITRGGDPCSFYHYNRSHVWSTGRVKTRSQKSLWDTEENLLSIPLHSDSQTLHSLLPTILYPNRSIQFQLIEQAPMSSAQPTASGTPKGCRAGILTSPLVVHDQKPYSKVGGD